MKKLSMILVSIILIFCSCASGIKGNLGGSDYQKLKTETQKKEYLNEFLENIEIGKTKAEEIEKTIGFPDKLITLNDGRDIWIYKVTSGSWLLIFGTASTKEYIFELKDDKLLNFYEKKSGTKFSLLYPTIIAEPQL